MHSSRRYSFQFHLLGWLIFMILPLLFVNRSGHGEVFLALLGSWEFWLFLLAYAFIFYVNYYLFIPRLFFQRRYVIYFLLFGAGVILVGWQQPFDRLVMSQKIIFPANRTPPPERPGSQGTSRPAPPSSRPLLLDIISIMLYLMIWAIGLAIAIARHSRQTEQRMIQAESDKIQAELSSLKAQINPHFLFNTLNTIYTLARINHPACAESIMKLSNIMRYVSDEVRDDFVPLEDEVSCIQQYIELQQLRLNNKTEVRFEIVGSMASQLIPPLILMTLVENIFKHGVSNHEPSLIEIDLVTDANTVTFSTKNRRFSPKNTTVRNGIGLQNVRKRLDHIYPGRYQLRTDAEGDFFILHLSIQT